MRQYYVYYSKGSVAPFTFSSKDNLSTGISSNFTFTVILSVFYLQLYLNGFSINIKIRIKILYKIYFLKTKTCSKSASKTQDNVKQSYDVLISADFEKLFCHIKQAKTGKKRKGYCVNSHIRNSQIIHKKDSRKNMSTT